MANIPLGQVLCNATIVYSRKNVISIELNDDILLIND